MARKDIPLRSQGRGSEPFRGFLHGSPGLCVWLCLHGNTLWVSAALPSSRPHATSALAAPPHLPTPPPSGTYESPPKSIRQLTHHPLCARPLATVYQQPPPPPPLHQKALDKASPLNKTGPWHLIFSGRQWRCCIGHKDCQ